MSGERPNQGREKGKGKGDIQGEGKSGHSRLSLAIVNVPWYGVAVFSLPFSLLIALSPSRRSGIRSVSDWRTEPRTLQRLGARSKRWRVVQSPALTRFRDLSNSAGASAAWGNRF